MREWNGEFLGGFKIIENELKGVISEIEYNNKKEKIKILKTKNGRNSTCVSYLNCRNWTITFGSIAIQGNSCITDFYCYWISTNGIDPAFTGNSYIIPNIASSDSYYNPTNPNLELPSDPPSSISFGYAESFCEGIKIALDAQDNQKKEIAGAVTSQGKVIMFPTYGNLYNKVNFPYQFISPQGNIRAVIVFGNPDPGDPKNDGKYQDSDVGLEITDTILGRITYYKIESFFHSHPLDYNYNFNVPSPDDLLVANSFPTISHYIINNDNIVKFNSTGIIVS
jgi:hypothetical protein